jgi:hypothetical protein
MSERVFRRTCGTGGVFEARYPEGVVTAKARIVQGEFTRNSGEDWPLELIQNPYSGYREVFDHIEPTELPPTTADLHTELAAYKQFADAIIASFGDDSKRNHQMDFQHAYDRLRAVVPTKGSEA